MRNKIKTSFLLLLTIIGMTFAITACTDKQEKQNKINITTTVGMITDVVQNVGGKHVQVTGLMGPGVDPHLYKAKAGDLKKLNQADIIFYNGLHLEGKMGKIFEKMAKEKVTVPVSQDIDPSTLRTGAENGMEQQYDPHIWFDVKYWIEATKTIRNTLIKEDAKNKADYEKNTAVYLKKLEELDKEVRQKIKTIPKKNRVLITAHDAFGYFGRAYGMEVKGLQGISTASEVGTKDMTDLREFIVKNKIKAVFIESSVPRKTIESIIKGAQQQGHQLKIGGQLFSDAMGEKGTPEGTYIGMVRHNVNTIVKALK